MSKLREQLIQIQLKNYYRNAQLIQDSLEISPSVIKYEKEYYRHLKTYQAVSIKAELIKKILSVDLVFQGDYHTLTQSQRAILRILRDIYGKRKIILCLEMFYGKDQKHIDGYMAKKLPERSFLRKIDYRKKWPFSWDNWRPIIQFCRERKIPILGINTHVTDEKDSLRERDRYSARIIAKALIRYPGALVYVVDGDFHIAPGHLPKEVDSLLKLMDVPYRHLLVYQNVENLYWKLCREGREEADVLKIDDRSYCVMNTMPANKVQSYLNWLEYSEDAYYPVHMAWDDDGFGGRGITVQEMVGTIASVLALEIPSSALDRLTVYYADNLYFMDIVSSIPEIKSKIRLIKEKIKKGEGFLLEYGGGKTTIYLIYLPNSSLNMAAEEAAHFVNAILRGPLTEALSPFDQFYRNAMTECLGFLGSKFINEKRKSHSENSLRILLGEIKKGLHKGIDPAIPQVSRYLLQHFYMQRKTDDAEEFKNKFDALYESRSSLPIIFSTQLGYILGNRLYYSVKRNEFPISKIREYFQAPFETPGKAFETYLEISSHLKRMKHISQY